MRKIIIPLTVILSLALTVGTIGCGDGDDTGEDVVEDTADNNSAE